MTHYVKDHAKGVVNEAFCIRANGDAGPGGAHQEYVVFIPNDAYNEELNASFVQTFVFQAGDPNGGLNVNGLTNEVLLAVVIDRLRGFESGPFATIETQVAIAKISEALECLHARTVDRIQRGVEGKQVK